MLTCPAATGKKIKHFIFLAEDIKGEDGGEERLF
jgi:hypothetical protein